MHDHHKFNKKLLNYIEHAINYFKLVSKEINNRKPIYELKSKKQIITDIVIEKIEYSQENVVLEGFNQLNSLGC